MIIMGHHTVNDNEEVIITSYEGFGKSITFNNHPTVPLYTVRGQAIFGQKDFLVGRYSKLEDAMKAFNNHHNSNNQTMQTVVFKIGDVTDEGTIMDITESWKPEFYKQPLYYVTHNPELYPKQNCGIWKLGNELKKENNEKSTNI